MSVVVVVQGEAELAKAVSAVGPCSARPDALHGAEKEAEQDRNDREDDQQFNECEGCPAIGI